MDEKKSQEKRGRDIINSEDHTRSPIDCDAPESKKKNLRSTSFSAAPETISTVEKTLQTLGDLKFDVEIRCQAHQEKLAEAKDNESRYLNSVAGGAFVGSLLAIATVLCSNTALGVCSAIVTIVTSAAALRFPKDSFSEQKTLHESALASWFDIAEDIKSVKYLEENAIKQETHRLESKASRVASRPAERRLSRTRLAELERREAKRQGIRVQ